MSRFITVGTKVFTPIDNALQEVKITKVFFKNRTDEEGNKEFILSGYEVSFNGETMMLAPNTPFYESEDAFRNGVADAITDNYHNSKINHRWYYLDGAQIKAYHAVDHIKEFYYDGPAWNSLNVTSGFLPELYESREEIEAYHELVVRYEDGREEVRKGHLSPLILTDEQMVLKNEFEALCKRMKEANIILMCDIENEGIYLVNGAQVGRRNETYYPLYFHPSSAVNTKLRTWATTCDTEVPISPVE